MSCMSTSSLALRALVLMCQRVLHANEPCVPTCSRAHVATYLACLCAHGSTCLACLRAHGSTCLACLSAYLATCPGFLRAHVLTCFTCSRTHVATCLECLRPSRVNMSYVLMYSRVNVACEVTCSRTIMPRVPCLKRLAWPRDHLPACLDSSVSTSDATFSSFTAIVVEVVHSNGKV